MKEEIHNKLKSERMKEMMDKYTNSFQAIPTKRILDRRDPLDREGVLRAAAAAHPRPQMAPAQPQARTTGT